MKTIKNSYLVKKRNILNQIRNVDMTLQEYRFFCIYLSKINPYDLSTRAVRFSISDFKAIMGIGRVNLDHMKKTTDSLLSKVLSAPDYDGQGRLIGYTSFQLFKRCKARIEAEEPYIEIDAHDEALPFMFDYKNKYFSYPIENILRVKSLNQVRMYELLRQYQNIGSVVYSVENLQERLGIGKDEYGGRFNNFRKWVLDSCREALEKHTDIKYTYEPHGKRGRGGKILELKFTVSKNPGFKDPLSLEKFIKMQGGEAC